MTEVGGEEEEASGEGKGRRGLEAAGQWKLLDGPTLYIEEWS